MNRFVTTLCRYLATLITISSIAIAQTGAQNDPAWETVKAIWYGTPLSVSLKDGTTLDGTMISVSATNLKMYKSSTWNLLYA